MAAANPNSYSQPITKIFERVERLTTKSGQVVEIRWVETMTLDGNTLFKKSMLECPNALADSRKIDDLADVRICCVCDQLYHKDSNNVRVCPICGEYFCKKCEDKIIDKDTEKEVPACKDCAEKENAGIIKKAYWKLYNLDK